MPATDTNTATDNTIIADERLRFERLLSDVSARFVNISSEQLDGEIENALKLVLEFFHVDRCGLIRTLPGKTSLQITHVAYADDQVSRVSVGTIVPREIHPWAFEMLFEKHQVLAFSNLDEVPAEAHVDKQTWAERGTRSTLLIPISIGESLDYVIVLNSLKNERVWLEELIPRLRLLGEIFVNAIERRKAEVALRESEEHLELATASAEVGVWVMHVDTSFVWGTEKLRELFGFAPDEELSLERFLEVIHPGDHWHVRDAVRQSLERRELLSVEYRILHPDGSIRWISSRGRSYSHSLEQPKRLMGISGDVTQRKMLELQLSESRALFSSLVDSTSDMIWSVDSERFGLLTFNRSLYEYFLNQRGIRIEAGMRPEELFPPGEFVQKWRMFYRRALEEGSFTTEYLVYSGTRTLRLSFNRLDRDDIVFGVSVFGRDITERKRAEEAIRKSEARYRALREELAHVTRVSTLGELTSTLAHEINQPLAAILNYANAARIILSGAEPNLNKVKQALGAIIRDDMRASEVIQNIRSLLKKEEIRYESLRLNEVIEEILNVICSDTALADVSIVEELDPALPPIWGDRVQVQQVILNLILNGAAAMKRNMPDAPRLILRTEVWEDQWVKVSVRDFGAGIDEDQKDRLFEPFYTTKPDGLGMGLAICHNIIDAHGGAIWAENNSDGGATFYFTLWPAALKGNGKGATNQDIVRT